MELASAQLHPLFPQQKVLEMVEELLVGVLAMEFTVLDQTDLLLEVERAVLEKQLLMSPQRREVLP